MSLLLAIVALDVAHAVFNDQGYGHKTYESTQPIDFHLCGDDIYYALRWVCHRGNVLYIHFIPFLSFFFLLMRYFCNSERVFKERKISVTSD